MENLVFAGLHLLMGGHMFFRLSRSPNWKPFKTMLAMAFVVLNVLGVVLNLMWFAAK